MTSDEPTSPIEPHALARRDRSQQQFRTPRDPGTPGQGLATLRISLWFGLMVGLAELGLTLAQKPLTDPSPGFFRMNRHIVWTIPTVNLTLFCLCGLALALILRVRRAWACGSPLARSCSWRPSRSC